MFPHPTPLPEFYSRAMRASFLTNFWISSTKRDPQLYNLGRSSTEWSRWPTSERVLFVLAVHDYIPTNKHLS
jgi:hypothetical protein